MDKLEAVQFSERSPWVAQVVHIEGVRCKKQPVSHFHHDWHSECFYRITMTRSPNIDSDTSRRSLSLTVLRWSQERVHTTKSIINDMLRWPELYDIEAPHLQAALEALEKAEAELNLLN